MVFYHKYGRGVKGRITLLSTINGESVTLLSMNNSARITLLSRMRGRMRGEMVPSLVACGTPRRRFLGVRGASKSHLLDGTFSPAVKFICPAVKSTLPSSQIYFAQQSNLRLEEPPRTSGGAILESGAAKWVKWRGQMG